MYELMGVPKPEPIDRRGRTIMDAGKDLEKRLVAMLHHEGVLLSPPPWRQTQMKLELPKLWLTGAPDAVVLPEGWHKPLPVEVKGKDNEAIEKMKAGDQLWDPAHRRQAIGYLCMLRELHYETFPLLDMPDEVALLYVSRNRPYNTYEFTFKYELKHWLRSVEIIRAWQELWIDERLPERDKSWRWGEEPCRWCDWKRLCKMDLKHGVDKIDRSHVIGFAKMILPTYDYHIARQAVFGRWSTSSQTQPGQTLV